MNIYLCMGLQDYWGEVLKSLCAFGKFLDFQGFLHPLCTLEQLSMPYEPRYLLYIDRGGKLQGKGCVYLLKYRCMLTTIHNNLGTLL